MIPTPIYEAFALVLGDAPLAKFPGVPLIFATETSELPESYLVLSVSLSAVAGMRANRTAEYTAEFSLCLRPENFSGDQVSAAVEDLVSALENSATAEALSSASETLASDPAFFRRCVFHSAFVERVAAPTFSLDRIVVAVSLSGTVQF